MEFLSDIELFYSENVLKDSIILVDDEFHHCTNVFRKKIGDEIFITDGKGKIFRCEIKKIGKKELTAEIIASVSFKDKYSNFIFCIPVLRNKDRFRFALEKLIELGITKIIIYKAQRSVADKINFDKINKISIETIKQSLQAIVPEIKFFSSLKELNQFDGQKIIFEQRSNNKFDKNFIDPNKPSYFIFGPEGGLTEEELNSLPHYKSFSLADNRLRSETAIIKVASIVTL